MQILRHVAQQLNKEKLHNTPEYAADNLQRCRKQTVQFHLD